MRKLASIRQIKEIKKHPNADALELAIVDGWQCVVAKGKHKAGDVVVYFEVDSILPVKPEFEFLRKGCYIKKDWLEAGEGFRIRTIKLRKEISQGLVMYPSEVGIITFDIDDDVTEVIGVVKYDPPIPAALQGNAKGNFPSFLVKTDQDRIQNQFDKIQAGINDLSIADSWQVSIKMEGSSMTIYRTQDDVWGVCSRNIDLKIDDNEGNAYVNMFHRLMETTNLPSLPKGFAIQGELMGPGIQGNIEKLTNTEFFVFNIFHIENGQYLAPQAAFDMAFNRLKLRHAPVIETDYRMRKNSLEELLAYANGPSLHAKMREGLVFKNNFSSGVSFKVVSNEYLLKKGE